MQQGNTKESNALRRTQTLQACGVVSGPFFYIF